MTGPVQPSGKSAPWRRWAGALGLLILLAPLGIGLLSLTGMHNRWVDILAQFTAPALIATLALTLLLALIRVWRAAIAGAIASGLLALAVWPQWAPASPQPQADAPVVRVYSANVFYLNTDIAAMRRSIEAADADIVILIELGQTPVERIDELLARYPNRTASMRMDQTRGPSRTVIASRWAVTPGVDPADGLHAVSATIETPLGPLNVVGAHLTRPWPFQNSWGQISQTMALDAMIGPSAAPVVVAGDFNSVSSARIGRQVKRDLGLHPAPGFPGTWPSKLPAFAGITIDQVYASPDIAFVSRRLGLPNGSDHRPVIAEVTRAVD